MTKAKHLVSRFFAKVLASACLMFTLVFFSLSSVNTPCTPKHEALSLKAVSTQSIQNSHTETLCNRDNRQISWLTWLFKEPKSAQTYFFDFLELLKRQTK